MSRLFHASKLERECTQWSSTILFLKEDVIETWDWVLEGWQVSTDWALIRYFHGYRYNPEFL